MDEYFMNDFTEDQQRKLHTMALLLAERHDVPVEDTLKNLQRGIRHGLFMPLDAAGVCLPRPMRDEFAGRDLGGRLALVMALVLAQETEGHPHTHDIPPLGLTIDLSDKAIDED